MSAIETVNVLARSGNMSAIIAMGLPRPTLIVGAISYAQIEKELHDMCIKGVSCERSG
jgi:hypothetical protein